MTTIPAPHTAVIIVAAGSGTRLGAGAPKAFVALDDRTVLAHALARVAAVQPAVQIVVVVPDGWQEQARAFAGDDADRTAVVTGGSTRQQSVAAGLAAVAPDVATVLVHDAARALTPVAVFDRVIAAVESTGGGVIPVLPVIDTLKRVDGDAVVGLVDRSELAAAQTPQGFPRALLETAYAGAATEFTDDAALVQHAGSDVTTVAGDPSSFKVTTPEDLHRARQLLSERSVPRLPRVGVGTDVHAFSGRGTLWLAGLEWPGVDALEGHSDGDAVAHAIVDALLSAAGLGDIGTHFGTARPEFSGTHGAQFLAETRRLVEAAGFVIGNVGVQVQAARPKFSPRRTEADAVLSAVLGAPVSVSATTTDGLGFVGANEGVQAFAVAMVFPR